MRLNIFTMLMDLKNTRAFKRIERVSFLGIVDLINQERRGTHPAYSRADHSLGVMRLGMLAARHIQMGESDTAYLLAACMVHDLGHPPFSHSLEYAFPKQLRTITHHDVLRDILLNPSGRERSIPRVIEKNGLSPERVYKIINGEDQLSFFFDSPANIDTLDGINRSMQSFGIFSSYNIANIAAITAELYAGSVVESQVGIGEIDRFWENKRVFYHLLSSENPLSLAERRFQRSVRRNISRLTRQHFNLTDREFVFRYPQIMSDFNSDTGPEDVAPSQNFIIDSSVGALDRKSIFDRYIRRKTQNRKPAAFAS